MSNSDKENKYFRARERVEAIKKFYTHLITYLFFICFLAGLNYYTDGWNYPWFLWAAFGWGIGVAANAIKVFGYNAFFGSDWEERKINEFMNEDKNEGKWN